MFLPKVITLYRHITYKLPTSYRHITNCRPTVGHLSADCFGENLSAVCRPTNGRQSANSQPTDGRQSADRRLTVGQQTTDSWPTGFLGSSSSQLPKFLLWFQLERINFTSIFKNRMSLVSQCHACYKRTCNHI